MSEYSNTWIDMRHDNALNSEEGGQGVPRQISRPVAIQSCPFGGLCQRSGRNDPQLRRPRPTLRSVHQHELAIEARDGVASARTRWTGKNPFRVRSRPAFDGYRQLDRLQLNQARPGQSHHPRPTYLAPDTGGSTSRQERPGLDHRPQATPGHHRRLGAPPGVAALVSPGHSGPAARAQSCLTRVCHRPVVWPHEIPDSGISHWSTGSSPRSGTEAGDISPVFAALEHAAGDFTTLGKNPRRGCSSPPSDTFSKITFYRYI